MQKICYIADEVILVATQRHANVQVFRERGVRNHATLHYFTTLPRIFGSVFLFPVLCFRRG